VQSTDCIFDLRFSRRYLLPHEEFGLKYEKRHFIVFHNLFWKTQKHFKVLTSIYGPIVAKDLVEKMPRISAQH